MDITEKQQLKQCTKEWNSEKFVWNYQFVDTNVKSTRKKSE